jgi:hypothetical protein
VSTRSALDRLAALAGTFTPEAARDRLELIRLLARQPLRSAPLLRRFHGLLLHAVAFPDDVETLAAAGAALAQFPRRIAAAGSVTRRALLHSGIAGTGVDYPFVQVNARWLASRWPDQVHMDWGAFDTAAKLDALLQLLCGRAELQVFDDATLTTAAWIRRASHRRRGGEPAWLFRQCAAAGLDESLVESVYNDAEVPLRWQLSCEAARTGNRHDLTPPAFRTTMRKPPANPPRWIKAWSGSVRRCPEAEGRRIIDVVQAALLVRCREVFSHQHANPADVYRVALGEGTEVVFLGVLPDRRLSLEASYGYILFANGVPLGYGGVTSLFGQANTGVNIFDEFRRGESAFLFAGVLGAARRVFGCERFVVNPYQFGADNAEAIKSGALWFYYRLGFRPVDDRIRRRAEAEFARVTARRGRRTPPALLRELAGCDLELVLPGFGGKKHFEERWLAALAASATGLLAAQSTGARAEAGKRLVRQVSKALGLSTRDWSRGERQALRDLAPVLAQIPDLARWRGAERSRLVDIIRAKGGASERRYAQLTAGHLRLRRALARAARRAERATSRPAAGAPSGPRTV